MALNEYSISSISVYGNLKRDYQFIWQLSDIIKDNWSEEQIKYYNEIMNDMVLGESIGELSTINFNNRWDYVSNLAQKVNLPQLNMNELTDYSYGEIDTVIPYGRKYQDIQVSYLDDEDEFVYKWHYGWFTMCQRHRYPLYMFTASAKYISYGTDSNGNFKDKVTDVFPRIYPKSVSRTDANKSGSGFSGVTVVYGQLIIPHLIAKTL